MGKGARNRSIRERAKEYKATHPDSKRTVKSIARSIRRHGKP